MVERSPDGREYYNSLFSIGTAPVQVYRKQHLVPFGEFVPPLFGWVIHWLKIPMQDFSSGGSDQRPMELSGQKVAFNICYEDAFGREIIRQLPEATILVNVSNTAWFGRSLAQPQHLQIARMRALETGRPMLRATNTGMTAVIDPRGRVLAVADPFSETVLRSRVQGHEGTTPFVRVGDGLAVGLALLLAAGLACLIGLAPLQRVDDSPVPGAFTLLLRERPLLVLAALIGGFFESGMTNSVHVQ
jgi:apolipoprotein N-acyltransferase